MAVVYFDSSAFVKLLVEEDEGDLALATWNDCDVATASRLAYPEVCAALAAAERAGRLDQASGRRALGEWQEYWGAVRPVELRPAIAAAAGDLARRHALRGADAVHLASALAVGTDGVLLATWDARLATGAAAAGLTVVPAPRGT